MISLNLFLWEKGPEFCCLSSPSCESGSWPVEAWTVGTRARLPCASLVSPATSLGVTLGGRTWLSLEPGISSDVFLEDSERISRCSGTSL